MWADGLQGAQGTLDPADAAKNEWTSAIPTQDTLIISRAPGKDKLPLKFF